MRAQIVDVPILVGIDLLPLQGLHEALATGVVVGVGRSAHARQHLMFAQDTDVLSRGILNAAVGVMHQAGPGRRSPIAPSSAMTANRAASVLPNSQPTTLREKASSTTARKTNSPRSRM